MVGSASKIYGPIGGSFIERFKENHNGKGVGRVLWEAVKVIAKKIFKFLDAWFCGSLSLAYNLGQWIGKDLVSLFQQRTKPLSS